MAEEGEKGCVSPWLGGFLGWREGCGGGLCRRNVSVVGGGEVYEYSVLARVGQGGGDYPDIFGVGVFFKDFIVGGAGNGDDVLDREPGSSAW